MTELIVDSTGTTKTIDAAKSAMIGDSGGLWGGLWGGGTVGRNQDLVSNKWGAASAYLLVPSVNRAVNLISDALNALTWEIVKNTTPDTDKDADEVVAKSSDVRPRHALAEAIKRGRKYTKQPLLSSICYSELLYGMVLLEPIPAMSKDRYLALRWLNPLGVSITVSRGRIDRFFYSGTAGAEPSDYFDPSEVAYTHNFNPYDDFRGRGVLEVAMDDINISRNLKRFVQAFFRNNARPSFIVSPLVGQSWSDTESEKIKRHLANSVKGSDEAFTTLAIERPMEFTPLEQPNPGEQYEINAELRREIYTIFGVPIAMAGDTEGTSYQNPKETLDWFYTNTIIPMGDRVAEYINEEVMPFFDTSGDYRFRFDTSEFDFISVDDNIRSEVADRNFRNGLWTLNQSLVYTKQDAIEGGDYRLVDGVPVPDSEVLTYWQHKLLIAPSVYNSEIVTGKPLPQPAAPNEVIPTDSGGEPVSDTPPQEPTKALGTAQEAYVAIPLPNNPYLMALQDEIRAMGIDGINYQSPETFHVTLLYSTNMSDAVLNKISRDDTPYKPIELVGKTIGLFENGDERALHIALEKTPVLMSVQRELYGDVVDNGLADSLSEYSNPKVYKPHITLAYLPVGVDVPLTCDFKAYAANVAFNRDNYRVVASVPVLQPETPQKAIQDTPEAELAAWLKVALKSHKRPFEPIHLRGDFGDWLSEAVQKTEGNTEALKMVFTEAKTRMEIMQVDDSALMQALYSGIQLVSIKAYSDTREAFVADLLKLFQAAVNDETNRRNLAARMRSSLNRYGLLAVRDGLNEAGADPEALPEEALKLFKQWRVDQSRFVTNFGNEVFKGPGITENEVALRANMWADISLNEARLIGIQSANPQAMMEWELGDAEEHCDDCPRLAGTVMSITEWRESGVLPGSGKTECKQGCKCRIRLTNKKRTGNIRWLVN